VVEAVFRGENAVEDLVQETLEDVRRPRAVLAYDRRDGRVAARAGQFVACVFYVVEFRPVGDLAGVDFL
jgi:hypothetical protein